MWPPWQLVVDDHTKVFCGGRHLQLLVVAENIGCGNVSGVVNTGRWCVALCFYGFGGPGLCTKSPLSYSTANFVRPERFFRDLLGVRDQDCNTSRGCSKVHGGVHDALYYQEYITHGYVLLVLQIHLVPCSVQLLNPHRSCLWFICLCWLFHSGKVCWFWGVMQ